MGTIPSTMRNLVWPLATFLVWGSTQSPSTLNDLGWIALLRQPDSASIFKTQAQDICIKVDYSPVLTKLSSASDPGIWQRVHACTSMRSMRLQSPMTIAPLSAQSPGLACMTKCEAWFIHCPLAFRADVVLEGALLSWVNQMLHNHLTLSIIKPGLLRIGLKDTSSSIGTLLECGLGTLKRRAASLKERTSLLSSASWYAASACWRCASFAFEASLLITVVTFACTTADGEITGAPSLYKANCPLFWLLNPEEISTFYTHCIYTIHAANMQCSGHLPAWGPMRHQAGHF